MRIFLLPENGTFYKANLHCHSTLSDGSWTVEEIKENYKAHGYAAVAFTDHDVFIPHNDLSDGSFIALNGYEIAITDRSDPLAGSPRTCHFCLIATDKDRTAQRIYYKSRYLEQHREKIDIPADSEITTTEYSPEFISRLMTEARNDGFFVTYNHPVWSLETRDQYCNYHGMHAMEIVNNSCVSEGYYEHNEGIYDDMLISGEKGLFCISTDDNHDRHPIDSPKCDSFGGFTMIKADKLEYGAITQALIDGSMYASEGPEIYELYFEDGYVHIKTSDAVKIIMSTDKRHRRIALSETRGGTINKACFHVEKRLGNYIRFTVFDREGKMANTHAYYMDTLPIADED